MKPARLRCVAAGRPPFSAHTALSAGQAVPRSLADAHFAPGLRCGAGKAVSLLVLGLPMLTAKRPSATQRLSWNPWELLYAGRPPL